MKKLRKILSIDGGGIRGIIPAMVLVEIEKRTGKRISELFDLIAGTSAGGIIALGLNVPDEGGKPLYRAQDLVNFFEFNTQEIFSPKPIIEIFPSLNLFTPKYTQNGVEKMLDAFLGQTTLTDCLTEVLVPAYEIEQREPYFFKSFRAKKTQYENFFLKSAARATSAAPTFFPPAKIKSIDTKKTYYFVDGGLFASNPAMCAYAEAKSMFPEDDLLILSLGEGSFTKPINYKDAKGWGALSWTVPLLGIMFDGMPDTVEFQLRRLLPDDKKFKHYFRFQLMLDEEHDYIDDTSEENLKALKKLAEKLIEEKEKELEKVCSVLSTE